MKGCVYAYGPPCPVCGSVFESVRDQFGDTINLICKKDFTAPTRYAVDGRSFRNRKGNVGRLFRDERGDLLYSFHAAKRLLEAIRHAWDKEGPARFDPSVWSRCGREAFSVEKCGGEWIERLEQSGKSKAYRLHAALFFRLYINPLIGAIDIRELTEDDVERLQLAVRAQGKAANTVKSCLQVLRTMLVRYRDRKRILSSIPAFPEGWSSVPHQDRWIVNESTQREIRMRMPEDTHLLMETYCALGCRPGEACGLKRRDLRDDGRVTIQRSIDVWGNEKETKTGRERTAEIPADLFARLRTLPVLPDAYLFTRGGKPFNPNRLSNWFRKVTPDHPQLTLYTFSRHSLATRVKREAETAGIREAAQRIGNTEGMAREHYVQ